MSTTTTSAALTLIGQGIAFGAVHVLTGPDHLSALATLSANIGNGKAFALGARWGIGHSIGLLLVGIPLIAISQGVDTIEMSKGLENSLESLVGIFMLLLGTYGMIRAFHKRHCYLHSAEDQICLTNTDRRTPNDEGTLNPVDEESSHMNLNSSETSLDDTTDLSNKRGATKRPGSLSMSSMPSDSSIDKEIHQFRPGLGITLNSRTYRETAPQPNDMPLSSFGRFYIALSTFCSSFSHSHPHDPPNSNHNVYHSSDEEDTNTMTQKMLAIGIGIVHGIAGPGGVLGLIPAIQLHDWALASIYLGSFCISSIVVMGSYAACYGSITARMGYGREFQIECFSASLSILVGLLWLVLLSMGRLQDVFP